MSTIHPSVTLARVLEACQGDEYVGFCKACGEAAYEVEPDARGYACPECGEPEVFGAEELLMEMMA